MFRALCAAQLVLWLLVPGLAAAQNASPAGDEQRAFLDLVINDVARGDALVVLRSSDALIPVRALREAGVETTAGTRETIEGVEYVSLTSLAPDVGFTFNERDLKLVVSVGARLLPSLVRDLQSPRPAGMEFRRDSSAFLNYALNAGGNGQYDLFTETGATLGRSFVYNTVSVSPRGSVRGMSNITVDQQSALRRWIVGDAFAGGAPLGGDALIGGISISREFAVDPYFVRYPTLSLTTPIATPSTVEVRVNGRIVRAEEVQPGRLDLRNLPLTTGHNDAQVIVRDAFGRTQELSTSYYLTASALARGLHDYQYSAGMIRTGIGTTSLGYEQPAVFARHRLGVTNTLTMGGRFELGRDVVNGGPLLNVRLPFGELETATAFSQSGNVRGTAALVSYLYSGRRVSGGGSLRLMSPQYATVTLSPTAARALSDASVFASTPILKRVTMTLQHSRLTMSDSPVRLRTGVQATAQVFSRADVVLTAARLRDERGRGFEVLAGMTVRFGGRTTTTISSDRSRDGVRTSVDLQQPLPVNSGLGYQLRSETTTAGTPSTLSGVLQYQARYGRYEVRREMVGTTARSNVTIAGGVVAIGGGVYATRPVRGSYALVRVPGVRNVRGFWSNQEVGKTDGGGNLFIPDLLPYYANQLKIADADVPLDYEIGKADMTLAPPYRGGAVALFPVQQVRRISGTLHILDGTRRVPATYGEISMSIDGKEAHSPIGADGRFYFENLASGRYPAIVKYTGGRCMFTISIPKSDEPVIDLGAVQCRLAEDR